MLVRAQERRFPIHVQHAEGLKSSREDRKYHVHIEPGAKSFDHRISGEADQSPDWQAGDLIIRVNESRDRNMGYKTKRT